MSRPRTEREELISRAFVALADTLIDEYDVIDLLDRLAGFSVQLLPADAAGIVLGDARRELRAVAASDEAAHVMELLQLQSNEGPCLDCFQSAAPVSVADLAQASSRWPTFVAAVEQRGDFRSVHALPLRLRGRAIGALNLFGGVPGPLPELDLALGQALADVATIGILQERAIRRGEVLNEQLQSALNSRVIIEQAKGVLAQYGELAPSAIQALAAICDSLTQPGWGPSFGTTRWSHTSSALPTERAEIRDDTLTLPGPIQVTTPIFWIPLVRVPEAAATARRYTLAGRREITEATRWAARAMHRPFELLGLITP